MKKKSTNTIKLNAFVILGAILFFIVIMCLSLYDYQAKASRYRKGLTYLKNRATTNQNPTRHSQNLKSTQA